MPPDYSGQNLRGRNFKGQNLEFGNFSGADIRSADFSGAILVGANFSGAKAGLQKRWSTLLVIVSWLLSGLSGLLFGFTSLLVAGLVFRPNVDNQIAGLIAITIALIFFFFTIHQGILAGLRAVSFSIAVVVILAFFTAYVFAVFAIKFGIAFVVSGVGAIAMSITSVFVIVVAFAVAFFVDGAKAITGAGVVVICVAIFITQSFGSVVAKIPTAVGAGSGILILLSIYIGWRTLKGDEKHTLIYNFAIAFAAFRGTRFHDANLTDANFTGATLKSTDFRKAILTRTCFHKTKKLDRVRPGITYLQNTQLRQLLVSGLGQNKNFDRQDLRGVNLQGANLADASFIDTDFSQANLHSANLFEAKLVRTNLDQANLSHAHLTGAYIEDWGITRKTKLDSVECKYVYLKLPTEGDRDPNRMPPSEQGDFGENDFNIFITSVLDTLDLYHKQDINAAIAITVLKGLTRDYPVQFELVGLEKRGNDQFLIRLKVFGPTSHFQLQREYYARYEQTLPLYDPKKLMPNTDILVEEIIKTVKENPGTRIENLHNEGIVITGGNVNMTAEQNRNINTGGGNYNENIQGDYIEGDYSPER